MFASNARGAGTAGWSLPHTTSYSQTLTHSQLDRIQPSLGRIQLDRIIQHLCRHEVHVCFALVPTSISN